CLSALGTGWGGAAGQRGDLLRELLPVLREAAAEHGFDVALVLRGPSDLAAAQRVRRGEDGGWDLPDDLRALAEQLGEKARRGQLAVFFGAGVSAAVGLPTWEALVDELAEASGLAGELREGLSRLPPQDSAALLARELGRDRLETFVKERFGPGPYALAHALVADLPVQEYVTTNYDPLVEQAARDVGRDLRVLPFEEATPGAPWLLKLHGDAAQPASVVLTREEYLRSGDTRAALAGVLHSLLLTRHVLFVGTSMLDDDLIRIAHQVRSALQLQGPESGRRTGTVLALREDPARARLWERDVETVAMAPADVPAAEAARRLEVFLDLVCCLSTPPTGYLLDPAYRGLLDAEECAVADALAEAAGVVRADSTSSAAREVAALLRRLGHGGDGGGEPPADGATSRRDDRVQEQRPG
ncbi:UNVERIFIED_ORG: SIR2 family protein, partial [Bacillus sp. AZ43]